MTQYLEPDLNPPEPDAKLEALADSIYEILGGIKGIQPDDRSADVACEALMTLVSNAYRDGYHEAQVDEAVYQESMLNEEKARNDRKIEALISQEQSERNLDHGSDASNKVT